MIITMMKIQVSELLVKMPYRLYCLVTIKILLPQMKVSMTTLGWVQSTFQSRVCKSNKPERVFGLQVRCRELDIFKILKKFLKSSQKIPNRSKKTISQKVPDVENIQFPTSHLEAENPFGLVQLENSRRAVMLRRRNYFNLIFFFYVRILV